MRRRRSVGSHSNTIVASAMASLDEAIKTWNDTSGKYNYIYKEQMKMIYLTNKF